MSQHRALANSLLDASQDKIWFYGIYLLPRTRTQTENCALLGYNAANSGDFLPTFRDNLSVTSSGFKNGFVNPDNETDRLSRNVGKKLPLLAAL